MKKFLFGVILVIAGISAYFASDAGAKRVEEKKVVVHDTIYGDTVVVNVRDTVFYDVKWLRSQFLVAPKAYWKNYGDGYEVEYPEFMNKVLLNKGERNLKVEDRANTLATGEFYSRAEDFADERTGYFAVTEEDIRRITETMFKRECGNTLYYKGLGG